jgi:zinc transport system permease protein
VVLAELAVLLGIAVAYYAGVTAGGVIVLVAVGIYACAVALGRVQSVRGEDDTPDVGRIEGDGTEAGIGTLRD